MERNLFVFFCYDVVRLSLSLLLHRGCMKRQENVTRSEEMAALVLTALSISPVFKDMDQSKFK